MTIYLTGRHVRTVVRRRPSYIRAEIGSWFSFIDEGSAKGEVEAKIVNRNDGSRICLTFNFAEEYALGFLAAVLGALPFFLIGVVLNNILIGLLGGAAVSALVVMSEGRAVSNTERKVVAEFDAFMQLFGSK